MRWFQPTSHSSESESGRTRLPQARCPALILKVHRQAAFSKDARRRCLDIAIAGVIFLIENGSQLQKGARLRNLKLPTVLPYFLYSLGILVREGSEALLVIVALLAAVREAGQERRARDIYAGALLAIGISLALAWAVNHLIADNTSDTLEGVFPILPAAPLFYVIPCLPAR